MSNLLAGTCKILVELDDNILLAAIIEKGNVIDYYGRPGLPLPNESRAGELATQTTLVMSMILKGQDYMGKLRFVHFHMEYVDGLHFSLEGGKILAIMITPQIISGGLVQMIYDKVQNLTI